MIKNNYLDIAKNDLDYLESVISGFEFGYNWACLPDRFLF